MRCRGEPAAADGSAQASRSQEGALETQTDQQLLAGGSGRADAASGPGTGTEGGAGSAASSGSRAADAPDVQAEEVGGASVLGNDLTQQASADLESVALPNKTRAVGGLPFDDSGFRDPHVGSQRSSGPGTARGAPEHGGHHQVGMLHGKLCKHEYQELDL